MLHYSEIELLVYSELRNYLDMLNCGIERIKQLRDFRIVYQLLSTVDELLNSVMHNPVVESMVEANHGAAGSLNTSSIVNFGFSGISRRS